MSEISLSQPSYRRTMVLDIETVSLDPNLAKGALDALTGRIVCLCMLIDDGAHLDEVAIADEDEGEILRKFWGTIQPTDVIVGHNVYEFDVPFLRQRSWIVGVRPSRVIDLRKFYSTDIRDTAQIWSHWAFKKFVTLDALGAALRCGQKSGHGMDVAQWWANRDLDSIKAYCLEDVRLTYRIYCRLTFQQPRMSKSQPDPQAPKIPIGKQDVPSGPNRRTRSPLAFRRSERQHRT